MVCCMAVDSITVEANPARQVLQCKVCAATALEVCTLDCILASIDSTVCNWEQAWKVACQVHHKGC